MDGLKLWGLGVLQVGFGWRLRFACFGVLACLGLFSIQLVSLYKESWNINLILSC